MNTNLPQVTKSPTDEKVPVNGAAQFISKYENAKWAEWHFVSPDGSKDLDYKQAQNEFKTMVIDGGYTKDLTLKNIPEAFNGWKVYCRFSNDSGSVNTEKATITVVNDMAVPKVTKSPTGETVQPGGAATFVANHEGAFWAEWHFANPGATRDLTYTDAAAEFPALKITGGDQRILKLSNIPAELNGWKVYCVFKNNAGTANTDAALITVQGQGQAAAQTTGFQGRWADETAGKCVLTFSNRDESSRNVDIIWNNGANERICWKMTAKAQKDDMMIYEDGHTWTETYTDESNYTVSNESYGGTGSFYFSGGKLYWYNDQTHQETAMIPA